MDSQTAVETFKINSTQKTNYNVIKTPINHYKPFPTLTSNNNGLSDLSFSAYLKNQPLANSTKDDPEIKVFDAQKYFSESNESKVIKIEMGSSNIINPDDSVSRISSVSSSVDRYGRNFRARSFHSTPTASSEASWNSQIGLLTKPHGGVSVSLRNEAVVHHNQKRSGSSSGKWFFCRKCPCAGKKSLQVIGELETSTTRTSSMESDNYQSNFHQSKTHSHKTNERIVQLQKFSNISLNTLLDADKFPEKNHKKTDFKNSSRISSENNFILSNDVIRPSSCTTTSFSFPVMNDFKNKDLRSNNIVKTSFEDPARLSLEVFQPPQFSRKTMEDDVASDASSDLFEIESFPTPTASYMKSDSLDEASKLNSIGRFTAGHFNIDQEPITPRTECYAPSEVSIDWSVTTAEGFEKYDDSSTVSRLRSMEKYGVQSSRSNLHWNEDGEGKKKKTVGNGLLGCRHENAVNVGPNPVKYVKEIPSILPLMSISGHVGGGAAIGREQKKPNLLQSSRGHARFSLAFA